MPFSASPLLLGPGLRNSAIARALDAVTPFSGTKWAQTLRYPQNFYMYNRELC
jgi:hypothetical protein